MLSTPKCCPGKNLPIGVKNLPIGVRIFFIEVVLLVESCSGKKIVSYFLFVYLEWIITAFLKFYTCHSPWCLLTEYIIYLST